MKQVIYIFFIILFSCGVSSSSSLQKPDLKAKDDQKKAHSQEEVHTERFSIIPYDIDDLEIPDLNSQIKKEYESEAKLVKKQGFRIQLIALEDFARAKEIEETVRMKLKDSDHIVYNDYLSPNYRIRVGDFKNRDDAKKILPLIHKLGYKDAFPVKDIVNLYSK